MCEICLPLRRRLPMGSDGVKYEGLLRQGISKPVDCLGNRF